jgi:hypothetical protein
MLCASYGWDSGALHTNGTRGLCMASMCETSKHLRVSFSKVDFRYVCANFANHFRKERTSCPRLYWASIALRAVTLA